jgi:hypothetical protein
MPSPPLVEEEAPLVDTYINVWERIKRWPWISRKLKPRMTVPVRGQQQFISQTNSSQPGTCLEGF